MTPSTGTLSGEQTAAIGVNGTLTELATGAAIADATVTVGAQPTNSCEGWSECGTPLVPVASTTTAANGTFTLPPLLDGEYFVTIAVDANPMTSQRYAILHRTVTVVDGMLVLGRMHLARLSSDESAWVRDLNDRRSTLAFPTTGMVVIDEYAEEQARRWASDVDAGRTVYTDAGYAPYQQAYANDPGAIGNPAGALDGNLGWQNAEGAWFAEKANCPGGNWTTCAYAENTGHYINLSENDGVWAGVGEGSAAAPSSTGIGGYYPYDVMVILYGQAERNS
ncbi:MAG TPA: carboxypeptidase-like regulatory domain-containing protein [Candidatus Acidoferrum sp.]|nr:carboxypeptidase-like regulatory domain-containing protein [Candidatus Acidoferrum sp.]